MEQKSSFNLGIDFVLKSSIWKVFGVFVDEPLRIHYVKEISRRIALAPTSVKKHLDNLEKEKIIVKKKGERFTGYIAYRDNDDFLFYKKLFNIIKIKESNLLKHIKEKIYPNALILYGSYLRGEDVESSDIDLFILSKTKKELDLEKYEKILKRKIHIIIEENLNKINENLRLEIINGYVLDGYLKYGR